MSTLHLDLPLHSLGLLSGMSAWGMLKNWWNLALLQLQSLKCDILADILWPCTKLSIPQPCPISYFFPLLKWQHLDSLQDEEHLFLPFNFSFFLQLRPKAWCTIEPISKLCLWVANWGVTPFWAVLQPLSCHDAHWVHCLWLSTGKAEFWKHRVL